MSVSTEVYRPKKGDFNAEGSLRYWGNNKSSQTGQYWVTPAKYEELCLKKRQWNINWVFKNPEKSKQKLAKWRAAHPEKHREYAREWKRNNKEKFRSYRKAHPEQLVMASHKIRAKKKMATDPLHEREIERTLHRQRIRLDECTNIRWSVDHIVPLSTGGKHHHANLQVLPLTLNKKKGHRLYWELPDCWKNPLNLIDQ
jgi:hypothetical protein